MPSEEDQQQGSKDIYSRLRNRSGKSKDDLPGHLKDGRRTASISEFSRRLGSSSLRSSNVAQENGGSKPTLPELSLSIGDAGGQLAEDDGIKSFMSPTSSEKSISGMNNSSYAQTTRSSLSHQQKSRQAEGVISIVKNGSAGGGASSGESLSRLRAEYEQRESQLKQEFERRESQLKLEIQRRESQLKQEVEEREVQRKQDVEQKQKTWAKERETLVQEVKATKIEASKLRQQNTDLKQSIAKASRSADQLTDDFLRNEMQNLIWETQNWVMNSFRKAVLKLKGLSQENENTLNKIVSSQEIITSHKVATLQALVLHSMEGIFKEKFYYGLPKANGYQDLVNAHEALYENTVHFNRWRAAGVKLLLTKTPQQVEDYTNQLINAAVDQTYGILQELTQTSQNATHKEGLRKLFASAVNLARLFRSQLATFQFDFPSVTAQKFNSETMEDVSAADPDEVEQGLLLVLSPVIRKTGDESGDQLHIENVVVKAKVLRKPIVAAEDQ